MFCSFEFKGAGVGGKGKVKRHPCIALETLDSQFTFTPWSLHWEAGPAALVATVLLAPAFSVETL